MTRGPTIALLAMVIFALTACAGQRETETPPQRQIDDVLQPEEIRTIEVFDPIERWNRGVYNFNAGFDRYVFLPVVNGYEAVVPEFVRNRITDFFSNLTEINTFINAALQLKGERAGRAALRFVNNVFFGFGGLYDITAAGGIVQIREDFGQTLGRWGVGTGPYLVLPIFGPSNLRDGTGLLVDIAARWLMVPSDVASSPAYMASFFGLQPIDIRYNTDFAYYETGSPFEYDLMRLLYTEFRQVEIDK